MDMFDATTIFAVGLGVVVALVFALVIGVVNGANARRYRRRLATVASGRKRTGDAGSAVDVAVRAMLAKHGLQDKRDLTMIEVRFPDQKEMLKEKKVDLITAVAPFGFDPELLSFAHPLFTQADAIGRTQMIVLVARKGLIDKHRDAMVDFLEDYIGATRRLSDPAHREEAVQLIVDATKQPAELYKDWVFTKEDYYRDPQGLPDLEALQANVDLAKKLGYLHADLEIAKYADLSLALEANDRIAANH